jgi:hypothetical protein
VQIRWVRSHLATHHLPSDEAPIVTEVRSRRAYVCCNRGPRAFVVWIKVTNSAVGTTEAAKGVCDDDKDHTAC